MSDFEFSYFGVASAGLLSFLSPCVLPLVPAYLCFLGGVSLEQLTKNEELTSGQSLHVFVSAVFFVLGFSIIFIALGASASAVSQFLLEYRLILGKIAGILIILFGLHFMRLVAVPAFNFEARLHFMNRPSGFHGAFLIGIAFAFGWTPCIGPVLATVLSVASRYESSSQGMVLLGIYAAGLGVPFLLSALLAGPFLRLLRRARAFTRSIEILTGSLLIITGLMFLFNSFELLSFWLLEIFPVLGEVG